MGRFDADYITAQRVYLANVNGQLVGFVSFHIAEHEWCLDLVRSANDAPNGTIHSLIVAAIADAASFGMPRVSLAAAPCKVAEPSDFAARVRAALQPPGLRQFKQDFAPRWVPLYAAAPSRTALWLGLADVALRIQRPFPLPASSQPHEEDEYYEVASTSGLCEELNSPRARKADPDDQPVLHPASTKRRAAG